MNNNQNSVFIVSYCSDTIEGNDVIGSVAVSKTAS